MGNNDVWHTHSRVGSMLSSEDIEMLRQYEEAMWREETRFDTSYMECRLAQDFVEFGRSGRIYDRAASLAASPQAIGARLPLAAFSVRALSDTLAQVTYDSCVTLGGDKTLYAHRSSLWSREADGWKLRFHQGTPFEPA